MRTLLEYRLQILISLVGLLSISLTGCGSRRVWRHPGVSQEEFYVQKLECRDFARKAAERYAKNNPNLTRPRNYEPGKGFVGTDAHSDEQNIKKPVFRRCMKEKGFSLGPVVPGEDGS
jgi:hypothetical protein